MSEVWQISADTGGTFTDLIGVSPQGRSVRAKVLSNATLRGVLACKSGDGWVKLDAAWGLPDHFFRGFLATFPGGESLPVLDYRARDKALLLEQRGRLPPGSLIELSTGEEAPILGARVLTRTPGDQSLPPMDLRLGTTRGTNALLERKGAKTVLFVTEGFADLLKIGDQRRPDLFALNIQRPPPLTSKVIQVSGRLDADGKEVEPLLLDQSLWDRVNEARAAGCDAAAVVLLHSYANPAHEHALAKFLQDAGFEVVTLSSELAPFIKLLPRAQTTVVDAYLSPIMNRYLNQVGSAAGKGRLRIMTSAGGLMSREHFRAKDALLSGPAGGVVGASASGKQAGFSRVIAFDMGGTSTDVSRSEGEFEYAASHRVGDASILAPALKIETVAAGGGSVCGWDGRKLFVGPDSAGAYPGPACYGAGGPLTVTDVNLLLGRVLPKAFSIPVYPEHARKAVDRIASDAGLAYDELLKGFLTIANAHMASAIETISVREGYDPSEYALVAFGGAGGLHACAIADQLGMSKVIFPPNAGILSAYGIQQAVVERIGRREVMRLLNEVEDELPLWRTELARELKQALLEEGLEEAELEVREQRVTLRFAGQESTLTVGLGNDVAASFEREYRNIFGYFPEGRHLEVVAIEVVVSSRPLEIEEETFADAPERLLSRGRSYEGTKPDAWARDELPVGSSLSGPAIVFDDTCTLFLEENWQATVGSRGSLRLERLSAAKKATQQAEAVALELFTNRFRQVVDDMGVQLERTSVSTNVKERLDFSCALLDAKGRLIANAPHIPVHLGAIGLCVRTLAERMELKPGDVVVTNHPGFGGSHLPDVTVVTPVFIEDRLIGYVANRAHHAELGGVRPGSMPPDARCLEEEGVVISPMHLFREGESSMVELEDLLRRAPYPSRALADNLADLNAQVASNRRGEAQMQHLARQFGVGALEHYMKALLDYSADALRRQLRELPKGERQAVSTLDDGREIHVSMLLDDDALSVDFSGTSKTHPGNFNASPAIVLSALVYVMRLLVSNDIPLNEGLLEPVRLHLPECFLNPVFPDDPREAPAVVGGNVETSQRIVECCLRALGVVADSQGTMNNFIFGNNAISYYETIGGGAGAGEGYAGASGVHTHMTNTAITDPEILERRYPIRLWRFALRADSGGAGRWPGGDGLVREVEFLDPVSVSLLTQHRERGPQGHGGGGDGMAGQQKRISRDGAHDILPACVHYEAEAGERLSIETPGGGGYGV